MSSNSTTTTTPATRLSGDFWKFWIGQTVSNLGSSFTLFALPLLIFKLTGSALDLGLSMAATIIPNVLFGLIVGAWVDRVNRKRLMIVADIARALVISSIPLLAALGLLTVWWIYAVGFISSTLSVCFNSAQFAAIPSLVKRDDLVTANGRIQASYSAASIAGPLLAGLLVALIPLQSVLLFDALSFLVSAGSLAAITTSFNRDTGQPRAPTSLRQDVAEGLRYVLNHPVLRNISLMMAMVNFAGLIPYAQLVLFSKERLGANDAQVGALFSAGSAGVIVLSLMAGLLRKRWPFSKVALGTLMLQGVLTMILAWVRFYWVAVPIWALIAGLGVLFNINTGSLRQAIVPNHMLGRVIGVAAVLAGSAIPLGAVAGGWAIQRTQNIALVYTIVGAIMFLIPLAFSFTVLGRAEDYLPRQPAADLGPTGATP